MRLFKATIILLLALASASFLQLISFACGQSSRAVQNQLPQASELEKAGSKLLYSEGDYDEALRHFQEALSIREKKVGADNISLALTLMEIAQCYRARGDYAQAESFYRRALAIRESALGRTHVDVRRTLNSYACLMRRLGHKKEADNLLAGANFVSLGSEQKSGPISGKVINGSRIKIPKPKYPKYAREQNIAGSVIVHVVIGENGKVLTACAVDGPPSLALVSEGAALNALFSPTTLNGIPVKVSGSISYDFKH